MTPKPKTQSPSKSKPKRIYFCTAGTCHKKAQWHCGEVFLCTEHKEHYKNDWKSDGIIFKRIKT